jgi:GT2 family glycosyltransferase
MKLLVVICSYRVTDLTIDCLRSLDGKIQQIPESKVAVIENGTSRDDVERLQQAIDTNGWGSWVNLTSVFPNRGFTGGNNIVIRAALASSDPPDYFFLLNADTIVKEEGALRPLVDLMDREPRAGIAGSKLLSLEGEVQTSAFRFPSIANQFDNGLHLGLVSSLLSRWATVMPTPSSPCEVDWVPGATMMLRRTMLEEIGLLDEGLYTYFDDIDLCLRAKRAGWSTWFVPESRIIHLEGASTGIGTKIAKRRPAYWFQARRRFFLKNYGPMYTALAEATFIAGFAMWRVRRRLQRKPDHDPPEMLADSVRHSVFCTGFQVRDVENPAMHGG